jgi:hypothetical protein
MPSCRFLQVDVHEKKISDLFGIFDWAKFPNGVRKINILHGQNFA